MRIARSLVASAVAVGTLAVVADARAEQGTIVLTTGEVLAGDVTEVVQGDHLVVRLPSGETRVVAWAAIGTLEIGASGKIVVTPTQTTTPPPPTPPPPPVLYGAPPPYYYAPPPPPPPPRHRPRASLGGRIGTISAGGSLLGDGSGFGTIPLSRYVGSGMSFQADLGFHFSPTWTIYGFWEVDIFSRGTGASGAPDAPLGNALGIGFMADTNPHGPLGFYLDLAMAYRWLRVPFPDASGAVSSHALFYGFEPFRVGMGMSIHPTPGFRAEIFLQGAVGTFTGASLPNGTCIDTYDCNSIPSSRTAWHTFGGIVLAAHFDAL